MFIRKRRNRSGSTSIVVVNKRHGQFVEVRNFGTAETDDDINKLYAQAHKWLMSNGGQQSIDFDNLKGREYEETRRVIDNMDAAMINGTQLLLTQIYDSIGFDRIHDDVLRHLVIARVSQPMSKLATVEYLKSYYDEDVDLNRIYRYMDRLYKTQQELERIIKLAGINMSISEVLKTARTIITVRVNMPENKDVYVKTLFLTKRQKAIEPLFKLSNLGLK